jgi:endonuclease/exonuclease/phosphatase family metal-dependent hydrolase
VAKKSGKRESVFFFLLHPLVAAVFLSCSLLPDPRPSQRLVLGDWNVENLFDEVDDGDEYSEFDPERGWTKAQFWHRCEDLARVIRTLGGGPDVMVLEEVEGEHALSVLNQRFLGGLGYRHTFLAPASVPGIKTAILSRFPLVRTGLLFPSAEDGDEVLRPLVEVEISLGSRALVIVANHWKSRIPTPKATERLRRESARVLRERLTDLEARADRPLLVAVGDFNTSLELSRSLADRALVSGGVAGQDEVGLVVFPGRASAAATRLPGAVWDPWETVADPRGSYFYQGGWDRLDHVFVAASSLRLSDWTFESFRVAAYAPRPQAYGIRTPEGISDHFPLVLTLTRVQP